VPFTEGYLGNGVANFDPGNFFPDLSLNRTVKLAQL
jgi:hypothetical protein